mmetsp:Transcript_70836/g.207565  ORF Transcript_70836/g.207565 Transcript_70836/m.207565 type:complete len:226 (+) Transcript_70836:1350-2027(+)
MAIGATLLRMVTVLPCIRPSTARSSSSMSSIVCRPSSFVCSEAMFASFSTTFSRRIISLALLMSSTSSSCCSSPSNLNTVDAISRTVLSIRSRGRTASSVTVLVRTRPLKSITRTMKTVVPRLMPACFAIGSCILKPTIRTSLFTSKTEAFRVGSPMRGVQSVSCFSHMNTSPPVAPPWQARKGPYVWRSKNAAILPSWMLAPSMSLALTYSETYSTHVSREKSF